MSTSKTILSLLTVFVLFAALTTSNCRADDVAREAARAVRVLTATARQLLIDLPQPSTHVSAQVGSSFTNRRNRITTAVTQVLSNGGVPTARQLEKLSSWLTKFHRGMVRAKLYRADPKAGLAAAGNMALAQGYVDCARLMVQDVR